MERKEFLSLIGQTGSLLFIGCLAACAKSDGMGGTAAPSNIDFTLDLSLPAYGVLNTNGGYLYNNGLIVARTLAGAYIAVQQVCTHESFSVIYQPSAHRFYCSRHRGTYSESGEVTGGPPPHGLAVYHTSLTNTLLRVYA